MAPGVVVEFEADVPVGVLVGSAEVPVGLGELPVAVAEMVVLVGADVAAKVAVGIGVGVEQPPLRETVGCAWSTKTGPSGVLRFTVIEL